MEVQLTPDQQALVGQAIAAGRLHDPQGAAREAFSLWAQRERRRAEILASVDIAEASLARGEGRVVTEESMRQLARDVSQRGRAVAMRNLGVPYDDGKGVMKDYSLAAYWYRKGADAGDAGGMNNLGILYENGTGVPKDINQAINWYTKAVAAGDDNGKTNLKRLGR
jgi:TPR repeat protein